MLLHFAIQEIVLSRFCFFSSFVSLSISQWPHSNHRCLSQTLYVDAIDRFRKETLRNFGVLEIHLSGKFTGTPRHYLAGHGVGKYSVADIGTWPWVKGWNFAGFNEQEMEAFPHLMAWIDRIDKREAVKRGTGEAYETNVDVGKQAASGELTDFIEELGSES